MKYPHLRLRCVPQRYLVSAQLFFVLMGCYMLRFSLSYALPKMTKVEHASKDPMACPFKDNETKIEEAEKEYEFHWTAYQQGFIHGGFFYGYMSTQFVGGILNDMFNHKLLMMSGYITTIVLVIATPGVTRLYDYVGLTLLRVFVGIAQGIVYTSMFAATAHWVPIAERAFLGSLIFTGIHMGNVVNGLLTGFLMKEFKWPLVFYAYGAISSIIAIIFIFTTYSYPHQFPGFSAKEQAIFDENRQYIEKIEKRKKIPFKGILTNIPVWAIFIAVLGEDWALYTFLVFLPSYFVRVQHITIQKSGYYIGTSFLFLWLYAMFSARIVDYIIKKKKISITWIRRLTYLTATFGCGTGFILIAFAGCSEIVSMVGIFMFYPILGLFYPSVKVNAVDLSPNFAATIGSIGNTGGCVAGLIVPAVITVMTPNYHLHEWKNAFLVSGCVVYGTGILYFFLASGEVQKFNSYEQDKQKEDI